MVRSYSDLREGALLVERQELNPGIYFLRMTDDAGSAQTVKLLIQE